eukprot:COSAG06_NODE_3731_length_4970_cov_4.720181_1_plen_73_part_00
MGRLHACIRDGHWQAITVRVFILACSPAQAGPGLASAAAPRLLHRDRFASSEPSARAAVGINNRDSGGVPEL